MWQPAPFDQQQRFRLVPTARLSDPRAENLFRFVWHWRDQWDVLVPLLSVVQALREDAPAKPVNALLREAIFVSGVVGFVTRCCQPHDIHIQHYTGALQEARSALLRELRALIDRSRTGVERYDEHLDKATILLDNYIEDPHVYQQYKKRTLLDRAEMLESNKDFLDTFVQEEIALRVERAFEEEDWELISRCFSKDKCNSFARTLVMLNLTRGLDGQYKEHPYSLGDDGPISLAFVDRRYLHVDQWPADWSARSTGGERCSSHESG